MATDLETDPKLVPRFIELAKEHPAAVITASRWRWVAGSPGTGACGSRGTGRSRG
ncbi:MAG: hypothetical protein M3P34_06665 [Actinomycetota bacterium]|nr:hypothetical protein [Actinomycetota bacterium]